MSQHTVRVVSFTDDAATKAIFELHSLEQNPEGIRNDDALHLQNTDGVCYVVNKAGVQVGKFPSSHPLNKAELTPSLRIETYKVIGRLDKPTLPRLHLRISRKENT